jgi:hypothetical protein
MPRYDYGCRTCLGQFEATHSYKDVVLDCLLCEATGSVSKQLNTPVALSTVKNLPSKGIKVGSEVISTIEETRKEIAAEKKKLKERKLS